MCLDERVRRQTATLLLERHAISLNAGLDDRPYDAPLDIQKPAETTKPPQ
jgi:hypothetical protein